MSHQGQGGGSNPGIGASERPDRRLEQLAAAERVPVSEETVRLLRQAVGLSQPSSRTDVPHLLERMRNTAIQPAPGTPSGVELLREDRNR